MKKLFDNIPVLGMNINVRFPTIMSHMPNTDNSVPLSYIDEEAYTKELVRVQLQRTAVYNEAVTKLPSELVKLYEPLPTKEQFRRYTTNEGNIIWQGVAAYDAAELAQLCGRALSYKDLVECMVAEKEQEQWQTYVSLFVMAEGFDVPCRIRSDSVALEQYNAQMRLMYVFPSVESAATANNTTAATILRAMEKGTPYAGKYFRRFYDNEFVPQLGFKVEQLHNGEVVNRFTSVSEAAKCLDISIDVIYRYLRNGASDRYDCTWRKINQK